jgi:hypothetical protein
MSAQTSYSINQEKAYAGMLYAQAPKDIFSLVVEPSAGIGFAVAVARGTDTEKECDLAGSADFIGITVRSLDREGAANSGAVKYDQYETAGVLRKGYVWAVCPAGCNPGDAVKYTDGTGVLNAGNAGAGETQLDGANWETAASAGGLAVIRLESDAVTAGS